VQGAVDEQMGQVVRDRLALGLGLAARGLERHGDVAEQDRQARLRWMPGLAGEREHVGRAVLAAPGPVQGSDLRVVGQEDAHLDPGA
jgi:hypothetical protein